MGYYQSANQPTLDEAKCPHTEESAMLVHRSSRARVPWLAVGLLLALVGCQAPAASAPPAKPPASGAAGSAGGQPAASSPAGGQPAPAAAPAAPSGPLELVKSADSRVLTSAPMYVALEKGYFREQGIDLQLEHVAGGADVVPFLATGDIDINLGAISVGLYNAFDRGADIRIIAPVGIHPLQDAALPLVVRKDLVDSGQVRTAADLRGRRVAVNTRGASVEYALTKVMERAGLTIHDVDQVPVPFPDMPAALSNGSVDAAIPAEPFATRSVELGVGVKLIKEIIPGQMTTVIIASGKFLRERPEVVKRWMVAFMKAVRDIQPPQLGVSDPAKLLTPEHVAIFEKYTGAPEQVIRSQVPYTFDVDLEIQNDSIMEQQLVHMRNGLLTLAQPIPVERMVDDTYVRHAQQTLGRLRQ
jgi:NitT/TauT family transport system substrate-binding protein